MTLGERIKCVRLSKRLTQGELSEKINVTEATISRWESGDISAMRCNAIFPLCKALGIDPNTLLGWEEEKPERTGTTYTEKDIISALREVLTEYLSEELTDTITINFIKALNEKGR